MLSVLTIQYKQKRAALRLPLFDFVQLSAPVLAQLMNGAQLGSCFSQMGRSRAVVHICSFGSNGFLGSLFGFQGILNGDYDDLPEQAFYMVGSIDEAIEKASKL